MAKGHTKFKPHKGLLKRVKVTGRGKVKFHGAGASHLMSGTRGRKCQDLRKGKIAKSGDMRRLMRMLNLKLIPGDRVTSRPAPAAPAAAAEAAKA